MKYKPRVSSEYSSEEEPNFFLFFCYVQGCIYTKWNFKMKCEWYVSFIQCLNDQRCTYKVQQKGYHFRFDCWSCCKLAYLSFHNQHKYCPVVNSTTVDYSAFWRNCICGGQSLHAYTCDCTVIPSNQCQWDAEVFLLMWPHCFVASVATVTWPMFLKVDPCSIGHDAIIKEIFIQIVFIHTYFRKKKLYFVWYWLRMMWITMFNRG